ncbi:hypothetical protein VTI74DRAFT_2502 [Chaetomium olivicolor]
MASTTSFRHRLQIQSQFLGGGGGSTNAPLSPSNNRLHTPAAINTTTTTLARPPLSPRGYSAAAATGMSRFVEGSMNDRVSAAPPPGFLGIGPGLEDAGGGGGWESLAQQHQQQQQREETGGRYHLRRPRSTAGWVRSSNSTATQQQQQEQQSGGSGSGKQGGGVVKKTSFLAPLWDGVKEKLHLNKSKSSGSIGRVVNSVVGGERRVEKERVERGGKEKVERVDKEREREKVVPATSTTGYPSREEVLESYKNLMASGFFEAHAIRGGRHPLRAPAGSVAGAKSFAEHMGVPKSPTGKSFADHMAQPRSPTASPAKAFAAHMAVPVTAPSPTGKSFADHMAAAQQLKPTSPIPSPTRMPPAPPRTTSKATSDGIPSPQRGTKRVASVDLAGDAGMATRKLVKKLRHSASRISMELTGREKDSYYTFGGSVKSRPSTSWNSAAASAFGSSVASPPSVTVSSSSCSSSITNTDETVSIHQAGKLTKAKEGRRRKILGLTRRQQQQREPTTPAEADPDPDAMIIDEPDQQQPRKSESDHSRMSIDQDHHHGQNHNKKLPRDATPPPPEFHHHHYHYPQRMRVSSTTSSVMSVQKHEHEPLSVVPDPNQGIPFVPRIPREFCEAMTALVPVAAAAPVVVARQGMIVHGESGSKETKRDSGLGEDVENIPVWG